MLGKLNKIIICCVALLLIMSFGFHVNAEEEYEYDYCYPMPNLDYYTVKEELLDKVEYKICSSDILNEQVMMAQTDPTYRCIDSMDRLLQFTSDSRYNFTSVGKQYNKSFLECVAEYDEAFFEDNFLAIVYAPMCDGDTPAVKRIDYVNSKEGKTVTVVLDFDVDVKDCKMHFVIVELPREYYGGSDCVAGLDFAWVELSGNPKTGDSATLLPAMGAMVVAAAGIVITKKRKK